MAPARRDALRLAAGCLVLLALFGCYHLLLSWLMRQDGLKLGVVRPSNEVTRIMPLYMHWRPHFGVYLLGAIAVAGGFLAWFFRTAWRPQFLLPACMAAHVAIVSSVGMIDGGPSRLELPYAQYIKTDYIGGVPLVTTPREFLSRYVELIPQLPMHSQTHPPGAVLFLWGVRQWFGPGPMAAALATILASSLVIPAVYGLAREVLPESTARLALGLFMLSSSVVLFSATCMDAVFMVPLVWTMFLLWRARRCRPIAHGVVGGLAASVAGMMTFSASYLALWVVLAGLLTAVVDRRQIRATCLSLTAAIATTALFYVLLHAWSGYDPLVTLRAGLTQHHQIVQGIDQATPRQHAHMAAGNLIVFLFAAGLPLAALSLRRLVRTALNSDAASPSRLLLVSAWGALVAIAAAPLYTLEVERIWMFLVPIPAITAAAELSQTWTDGESPFSPAAKLALVLQAVQTIVMETLLHSVW